MTAKARLIFDVTVAEKTWLESILQPGQTKIGLLRELLDDHAKKNNLPERPSPKIK